MKKWILLLFLNPLMVLAGQETNMEVSGNAPYNPARPTVVLTIGNDLLGLQHQDENLTSNLKITVAMEEAPQLLKDLLKPGPDGKNTYSITAAQYIYTPNDLDDPNLIVNDRPYAGYLFIRLQSSNRKENILVITGVDLGIVGPASGGEALQQWFHKKVGSRPAQGWDHQLNDELGVNVFQMRAMNRMLRGKSFDQEFIGNAGASLGNINTSVQTGVMYRIGRNMPDDMGAMFYSPGEMSDHLRKSNKISFYVFASAQVQLVARDIFLDGNTFSDSHSVEKNNFVNGLKAGFVVGYKGFNFGYVNSNISERFKGQQGRSLNGTFFFQYGRYW